MNVELILYATPRGPLGDACSRYFDRVHGIGPTTAQRYPPHCTLTGFFQRPPDRVPDVVADVDAAVATVLGGRAPSVEVTSPRCADQWVGIEVRSADLLAIAVAFAERHRVLPGEDAIRLKDWLHLSLAYPVRRPRPYLALAAELADPALPCNWDVALWRRDPGDEWRRLTAPATSSRTG